jgi:hypothetical protein
LTLFGLLLTLFGGSQILPFSWVAFTAKRVISDPFH